MEKRVPLKIGDKVVGQAWVTFSGYLVMEVKDKEAIRLLSANGLDHISIKENP